MSSTDDSRWNTKKDNVAETLHEINSELIQKYKAQCEISKGLQKENDILFDKRRKYTVAFSEIKKILEDL